MTSLYAVSDLHVGHTDNRALIDDMLPSSPDDWLIVAGDVAERIAQIRDTLARLRESWSRVIWVPGNHELWCMKNDRADLRGEERYRHLVDMCRGIDVTTPEDEMPVWPDDSGPVVIVPLFVLYDYSFRDAGMSAEEALQDAYDKGIVCTDEFLLDPEPYPTRQAWCAQRVRESQRRLDLIPRESKTILVNHYPLKRIHTRRLFHQTFAQWCGTTATEDWHTRYRATDVIFGHLHIPGSSVVDGVRFHEVSIGYPRERRYRGNSPLAPRLIRTLS
ncbi:metallophosphoesterase family protein [Phytoactinopolyspora halophila]|uniref:metallophosphoesterase family protein n=1 Tax=Phytoactinopolyspora halophila TaxID=1981511 RepID=UPI001B8D8536|nr:metallophosphoesterase [Phytoactinopolyspora halophila]